MSLGIKRVRERQKSFSKTCVSVQGNCRAVETIVNEKWRRNDTALKNGAAHRCQSCKAILSFSSQNHWFDTRCVDHMVLAQRHLSHGQVSLETSSLMAYGRRRNLMSLYSLIYYRQRG